MKKFTKAFSVFMASALLATSLVGCGDAQSTGATETAEGAAQAEGSAAGATFKIGAIGPLTGGAAAYGNAVCNAAELAVAEINAAGGINGYQVEYSKEDDELSSWSSETTQKRHAVCLPELLVRLVR